MLRLAPRFFVIAVLAATAMHLRAQTPAAASPPPAPSTRALIDSMSAADVQQALDLLKRNYLNADALSDTELERARLEGVLLRVGRGVILSSDAGQVAQPPSPFYSDILSGHVAYFRAGDLNRANLSAMDAALQTFASKKIDALIIDLRASGGAGDFESAAEFAKRFCPKGKTLFTLRKTAARQERTFTSDRDPTFQGLVIVLADGETSGTGEAVAGVLRFYNKALIIGATTAGRAVEYSDFKLAGGKVLRVATAEAVLPEGNAIFPAGLKPDLPVEMPPSDKREIFQQSREKGMGPFVFDTERPHMNEAALMAGRNPEIEALEASQRRSRPNEKSNLRDPVVQRALDVVTSISVYQRR